MPNKANYVRSQRRAPSDGHTCHADGCSRRIKPSFFMCFLHWTMLPQAMRTAIWKHFRPGQEKDKNPSAAYLRAAREAVEYVKEREAKLDNTLARADLRQGGLL